MDVVVASSSIEAGIGCWDLHTGAEQLRYKLCASPPHGLVCVGQRFLASSQLREPSASGSVQYWSWSKPQVDVKSFPAEQIKPLASNSVGTYIVGGGLSGNIYLWEVASGRLLKKWHAHYRAVSCLVFSDDDSLLISGSEDGGIRVWSLLLIFDDFRRQQQSQLYEHNFREHTLCVTDVSQDMVEAMPLSCLRHWIAHVWSISKGKLLRDIVFPTIVDAIALDPGEHVFFAGGRDGKIYVAALNAESTSDSKYGLHIIDCFSNHSNAVTCLVYSISGNCLISGSEDGMVRVWDAKSHNIVRVFKHAKGPVNNILVINSNFLR
ncbi:protein ROOT INITIATION DEFECTIVE 3 [Prunus yedoensis var. nudiflora]|uniref:Protein ROOT INITIATION DEFECTIVE 3 n=1 Tax=Prunus yedoensis var. nudiflora TaxID=2094558 RepID=A0A314ZDQ3_PRUYE|nr:protein ROOT INITIATION DEFECTIVE 3 [Prunus yedoensis var. nudiflora]